MLEKAENNSKTKVYQQQLVSNPVHQWRLDILIALAFVGMVVVWSIDSCTIRNSIEVWSFKKQMMVHPQSTILDSEIIPLSQEDSDQIISNRRFAKWATTELEPNFTATLVSRWLAPACTEEQTMEVVIPDMDGKGILELTTGDTHRFIFHAVSESNNLSCSGGDYFESDLSGESWKSRPLIQDLGNGSYSITLQVHPDFAGDNYYLTLFLLFRHFQGLKLLPNRFAVTKKLRNFQIRFVRGQSNLPALKTCGESDFRRELWVGRWTRHAKNEDCKISENGRFRCLDPHFPCERSWCDGWLGSLESNGWVYSTHCSFRIFQADSAWNCLRNKWIFFSGDSNHVDSIRNLLNFVLDLPDVKSVPRRFDLNFTNPKDTSQSVRITSIFNGHWNDTQNGMGLDSFRDEGFRNLVKRYFVEEETVPDTIIMNSGLHDGVHSRNVEKFAAGADNAARFWKEVMDSVRERGMVAPKMIYRTTVAPAGTSRVSQLNPSKMEAFNWMILENFRRAGLLAGVIDNFDMTFPWHFNNRCSDGQHYGRPPSNIIWKDGEIGHQYFVDIMLLHVLLNVLCST